MLEHALLMSWLSLLHMSQMMQMYITNVIYGCALEAGMHRCAWVWVGALECARVGARGCVWEEFSEYLLETWVLTSADFNTYPIRVYARWYYQTDQVQSSLTGNLVDWVQDPFPRSGKIYSAKLFCCNWIGITYVQKSAAGHFLASKVSTCHLFPQLLSTYVI